MFQRGHCIAVTNRVSFSAFFVATQFFFTLSFINVLVAIVLVVVVLLCLNDEYRPNLLKIIGIDLLVAGQYFAIFVSSSSGDDDPNKHVDLLSGAYRLRISLRILFL